MINYLHTNIPESIFLSFGSFNIYYYGLLIALAILIGVSLSVKIAGFYGIKKDIIIDSAFWLVIFGILGGRIYHVLLELPYYLANPLEIFMIWHGGLAIHGGIIAGIITIYFLAKKYSFNPILFASICAPALALGQAIGRWGNYFNQELYGKPTDLPWGIPIQLSNRINEYSEYQFFHPTFLYESIGSFFIFLFLIALHYCFIKNKQKNNPLIIVLSYLILYSILRFSLEFIKIDKTPELLNLRVPQIISLIIITIATSIIINQKLKSKNN